MKILTFAAVFGCFILLPLEACKTTGGSRTLGSSGKKGGVDAKARERKAAWFVGGTGLVLFCVKVNDVTLDQQTAADLVLNSFSTWKSLISRQIQTSSPKFAFPTEFKKTENCEEAALEVYFGTPPRLDADLEPFRSFGTAQKLTVRTGTSKLAGFLWVAGEKQSKYRLGREQQFPGFLDWQDSFAASIVLTQHFGYIFGNEETPNSPLDEEIVNKAINSLNQLNNPGQRARVVDKYEASIKGLSFRAIPDPTDEFGENPGPCELGIDVKQEFFVRDVQRWSVPCYFYETGTLP